MKDEFANNADLQAARATRVKNDVQTLVANWNRNELFERNLNALNGLRGKGYEFGVGALKQTTPSQAGENYVAPVVLRTLSVTSGKGMLKSGTTSTMTVSLDLDGQYSFQCDNGITPRTEKTTVANRALTTLQGWLLDVQDKHGIECMTDLTRQRDRVESDKAKTAQKRHDPKAA